MGSQDDVPPVLVIFLGALGDLDLALEQVVRAGLGDARDATPRLEPTARDLDDARALLARARVREPFAVVHPGAGARSKRAPPDLLSRAIALTSDDDVS